MRSQLAHGANPSPPDAGYSIPVALAVRRGQLGALRALLEAGADANQPDYQGAAFVARGRCSLRRFCRLHRACVASAVPPS